MTIHIQNECDQCGKKALVQPASAREDTDWLKVVAGWVDPQAQLEFDICSLECLAKWCLSRIDG